MHIGWIGGIVGLAIGSLGGAVGTYYAIKNVKTQAEKRFLLKCSIGIYIVIIPVLGLLVVLFLADVIPAWAYFGALPLIPICLFAAILWINRRLQALRDE